MAKKRGIGGATAPAAANQPEAVEPVMVPEMVAPTEPAEPVVKPVEPTEVVEPVEPTEPLVEPVEPIEVVEPVEPTEPLVEPVEPIEAQELPELIEQGRKAYPSNKTFYLTSDHQLFLADARNLALLHQRSLKGGEVQTFDV